MWLLRLIRQEASEADGRIVMKVNNLIDQELIDALYEAALAVPDHGSPMLEIANLSKSFGKRVGFEHLLSESVVMPAAAPTIRRSSSSCRCSAAPTRRSDTSDSFRSRFEVIRFGVDMSLR